MNQDDRILLGQVMGEVKGINARLDKFNGQIGDVRDTLRTLPCVEHGVDITALQDCNILKKGNAKTKGDRRTMIMSAAVGAAIGAGITFISLYVLGN